MQVSRAAEEELPDGQVEEEQITRVAIVCRLGLNVRLAEIS